MYASRITGCIAVTNVVQSEKNVSKKQICEKKCPECNAIFSAGPQLIYCSDKCKKEHYYKSDKYITYELNKTEKLKRERREKSKIMFCPACGNTFNSFSGKKFCSSKCGKAYRGIGRKYAINSDERLKNATDIDKSVNLHTLIKRDDNICKICNCRCDLYDYEVTSRGAIMCGDTYPTIDHIIPLAKGGKHKWDNVQLACLKCNREKSDK